MRYHRDAESEKPPDWSGQAAFAAVPTYQNQEPLEVMDFLQVGARRSNSLMASVSD